MASQTSLLDVFDSMASAGNTVTSIFNREMEKEAQIEVQNWQANFRVNSERFLQSLNNNKYETWGDDLTTFLEKERTTMQENASNPYTVRQIDALLTSYSATMRNQVEAQAYNRMQEHSLLMMQDTADINRRTLSGQARIDANGLLYKTAFDNNFIDETNYRRLLLSETEQTVSNYYTDMVSDKIDEAFKTGMTSWADIETAVRSDAQTFSNLAGDQVDQEKYRDTALQNGEKLYYARLQQIQDKNSSSLSEAFLQIVENTDPAARYNLARTALAYMDTNMSGDLLAENSRLSYTKLFSSITDGYLSDLEKQEAERARAAASASGGSGGSGTATAIGKEVYEDYMKASPNTYLDALISGKLTNQTYYDMKDIAVETMYQAWTGGHSPGDPTSPVAWKEAQGLSDKQLENKWILDYGPGLKQQMDEALIQRFEKGENFKAVYDSYNRLQNDVKNSGKDYDADNLANLFSYVIDLIASTPADGINEIPEQMEKYINTCVYTKSQNKLFFNPDYTQDVRTAYSDKEIAQFASAAADNDIIFTDLSGNRRIAHGANTDAYIASQRYAVASWLGLDDSAAIDWQYEPVKNDENTTVLLSYAGRQYKVEADENGKDYKVYDVTNGEKHAVPDNRGAIAARREAQQQAYEDAHRQVEEETFRAADPEVYDIQQKLKEVDKAPPAVLAYLGKEGKTYKDIGWDYMANKEFDTSGTLEAMKEGKDGKLYVVVGMLEPSEENDGNMIKTARDVFNNLSEDQQLELILSPEPEKLGKQYMANVRRTPEQQAQARQITSDMNDMTASNSWTPSVSTKNTDVTDEIYQKTLDIIMSEDEEASKAKLADLGYDVSTALLYMAAKSKFKRLSKDLGKQVIGKTMTPEDALEEDRKRRSRSN